jgi:outer membrane lipase/esterase
MGGRVAICLAALLASAGTALGQSSFNTIYGFGDSYADTNQPGQPGGILPEGVPFPADMPEGRFSSGGNFVDRLQDNFGIPASINYAFGGAMTDTNNVVGVPAGFQTEIAIVQLLDQTFRPDDIIALSIGGNNALAILDDPSFLGPDPEAGARVYAQVSAAQVGAGVQELVDRGARTITYFSIGDPFLYPSLGVSSLPAQIFLEDFLVASEVQMAGIAAQGVRVNFFNFAELQRRIFEQGDWQRFGFEQVGVFGLPSVLVPGSIPCLTEATCSSGEGFFYWDAVHLTEEGYNLAADFMTIQLGQNETIPVQAELAEIQSRNFTDTLHQRMQARRDGATGFDASYSVKDAPDAGKLSYKDAPEPHVDDAFALFVAGGFAGGDRDARDGIVAYDYDLRQIVVGGEWKADEHVYLGGAIGYSNANAEYGFLRGEGETDLDSVNIGVYGSLAYPNWFADLALAYSINSYDLNRTGFVSPFGVAIPLDTSAEADGDSFAADFRTGYLFRSGGFGIGPIAGLSYTHVTVDGYTESGDSLLSMRVEDQELDSLIGSIGLQVRYRSGGIEPYVAVTVEQEFMDGASYDFALTSASLVVNSVDVGQDDEPFGRVRAGINARLSDQLVGSIDGNATFGRETGDDYAITGALKFQF